MMSRNKEDARANYLGFVARSWTWARLTSDERARFARATENAEECGGIFGTYEQRWKILNWMYDAFLEGCGYEYSGWREPEKAEATPGF